MDYVRLGKSGLLCSVIGLGGGSSSRFGLTKGGSKSDALRLIGTALDEGITFFDGAGLGGGVDELLAEALGPRRRDVVLSTKIHLGPDVHTSMPLANRLSGGLARRAGWVCSRSTLRRRIESTLKALRTDRIDLLHLHAVSPRQYRRAVTTVLPELLKMKAEGKLRAIGVTEPFLSDPGHEMLRAAAEDAHFDAIMLGFNAAARQAADAVLPAAEKGGVGVIAMFALRGLLGSAERASRLNDLLNEEQISLPDLAYRYCRHSQGIQVVLTGTGNAAHLRRNVAAALAPPLPKSLLERLDQLARGGFDSGPGSTRN